jgi:H+-translocating NAD(P) transhydrogenase subunit alpha
MIIGVPKELFAGENRVALVPSSLSALAKAKVQVMVEHGAGTAAGFPDKSYADAGAQLSSREEIFKAADVIFTVRCLGADPENMNADLDRMRPGQILIGTADPLTNPQAVETAAERGVTAFSLELIPRTTKAQAMDVLSSQANLAGYKAVLIAANELPKILPMMTTAAGTIAPAKALIIGAGVAGLQAIATAKRLGSVVTGYDVRSEVKQQIESLGARFLELPLEAAAGVGGYAKQMDEAYYAKQRELMSSALAETDYVVTTAAIPGKKAPILITQAMVEVMKPGSVIVDIAAERGGNCELTKPGETVFHHGVKIVGPLNVASTMPFHASTLFAKNISTFMLNMLDKEGNFKEVADDPIINESILTRGGEIVNTRVQELLGKQVALA